MILLKEQNLTIRFMRESDCETILENFKEQGWNKDIEVLNNYYKEQKIGQRSVIVAQVDDDIAGYITLISEAKDGPFSNKNIPEIVDFNVFIKYQKNGIGNKLMDVVEILAKKISNKVSLGVGLHYGYGQAQRMYVKRGYIFDGSGVWYQNKQLEQYTQCANDDDLILYMIKEI